MSDYKYPVETRNGRKQRVHRHVMEDHLGRYLESHEHVFHLDGDHLNNKIENLVMIIRKKIKKKKG